MYSSSSAGTIIKSVKAVDRGAVVRVDLMNHKVEIEPGRAEARELSEAIGRAGFTPVAVQILLPFQDDLPNSGTGSAAIAGHDVVGPS